MKTTISLVSILLIVLSCSKDEESIQPVELKAATAMNMYCQSAPNNILRRVEYEYANGNLISQTTIGEFQEKTIFEYNSDNQLILETYESNSQKVEKTFFYNDLNQLVNIKYKFTYYDENGQVTDEDERDAPREYENNKLVKEWYTWGGFSTYEYTNDKVETKIDYTTAGDKHHITSFTYFGNLLIEEKKETVGGSLMYLKTYNYDSKGRLIDIRDGGNIIEDNEYTDDKLIEKRTYYFGIDPGFDICYGNYLYQYEY
jgi:hypothetical protein